MSISRKSNNKHYHLKIPHTVAGFFLLLQMLKLRRMRHLSCIIMLFVLPWLLAGQQADTINRFDKDGKRQGYWIQKYPSGKTRYEGYFKDDNPSGVFKRYYENDTLQSVLFYSSDGKEADAIFFHSNGFIASAGKYINRKREGKWSFYSSVIQGYLVAEETYRDNLKNGPSFRYHPDKTIAEKLTYINDVRNGQWEQYRPGGIIFLRATYRDGKLNGPYEIFHSNGNLQYKGQYSNDRREGKWLIYNPDGTLRKELNYVAGLVSDPDFLKENALLDSLDVVSRKYSDPEKTGSLW